MSENRIVEILKEFEVYDERYKRAEVDAAIELREEITPHLIAILEGILFDPLGYLAKEAYSAHIYALMLLTYFKEQAAHQVIVDLFSLVSKMPHRLFGDITTEELPKILFHTCGGDVELIKSLILNREADEYCRGSAQEAMVLAVADDMITREEALTFFASLFTGDEADEDAIFWDQVACSIYDLYPEEVMDVIEHAYSTGMIAHDFIHYYEFTHALTMGKAYTLKRLQEKLDRASINDLHNHMPWWGGLKQDQRPALPPVSFATLLAELAEEEKRIASSTISPSQTSITRKSGNRKKKKRKKGGKSSKKKRRK